MIKRLPKKGRERHGRKHTPEYKAWENMKQRCTNKKHRSYGAYGGRGIDVAPVFHASFQAFFDELGSRPSPNHSVQRLDKNQGYWPGNIKWALRSEENKNQRKTILLRVGRGERKSVSQLAQESGMQHGTLLYRLRSGLSLQEAISRPVAAKSQTKFPFRPFKSRGMTLFEILQKLIKLPDSSADRTGVRGRGRRE